MATNLLIDPSVVDPNIDKLLLARAIEEKRRRLRENGIKYYDPQPQQLPFHKSCKRIRAVFGGNRSGKTVGGATEAVWYATGTHPHKHIPTPNYGRVCCTDFTNGIEKVILPEIHRWLPKNMIKKYDVESRTLYLTNGSTIEFMSYDQDVEKFESASRHWVWFDEEPPQNIFKACQMRLIDTKGDLWMTMTPLQGLTWVYSDIYENANINKNIDVFVYTTTDNPHIDAKILEETMQGFSEQEKEARIGGKFIQMSGLIYREYSPDKHNIDRFPLPAHFPRICAIDPHPRTSTVVEYMAVASKRHFVMEARRNGIDLPDIQCGEEDNVYIIYDEVYTAESLLISEVAKMMKAKEGDDYIYYRLIDNSANTPDPIVGTTIRQEFSNHGIRTILADKDVANRIFKVREKLANSTLFFFRDVQNALWEIRHYAWDDYHVGRDFKDPKEKPRKKRDHAMDCIGYMVSSNPRYEPAHVYRPERKTVDPHSGY